MAQLSNQYPSLQQKQVFITGGGSGIGANLVMEFCRQGAEVAFVDIDDNAGQTLVKDVADKTGITPIFYPCDVRDTKKLQHSIEVAQEVMGGLTTLINNAGKDDRHAVAEVTEEFWDNCMDINLKPHFFTMQKSAQYMKAGSSIINMGSISWMRGRPGIAGYTCAKGAISALTRTMARELGPNGIRVNSVVPGAVVTERQKKLWLTPEVDQGFYDIQALKFRIQPDDIVAMTLFLASDDSRACAGQNFIVDAGIV
jgi:NAD(P)-dependent dehydrogenase (short-subunit alcohol dehydrogenase family)